MDTEAFERLIEGAGETPGLDFKAAGPWEVDRLVKDVLAMSNVRDGGHIVVGIAEPFVREGVSAEVRATYSIEIMRDQMAGYADPRVDFSVQFPKDRDGRQYVVIRVNEFADLPVICRRDGRDVRSGTLYYRNRNRRIESAAIANAHELREVLTLAAVKMMRGFADHGLRVDETAAAKLDEELGGL
jgi:hypothetical protein